MPTFYKTYLRRLTNLTSRNRSLLLLSLPKEQFIDLQELDFLDNQPAYQLINQLLNQKKEIPLCDILDSRFEKNNIISKQLSKIAKTEKVINEERGSNDLYVGYPFIKGKLSDGTVIRCPLLFWSVSLKNNGKKWLLAMRDEPATFNRSFILAYAHFNQVKISEEWLEYSLEDLTDTSSKNSLIFKTELYELLKNSPFEINFNSEIFNENLHYFEKYTKSDLEQLERNGELKLFPQAVLGIFPQAGSFLVPDYNFLIEITPPPTPPQKEGEEKKDSLSMLPSPFRGGVGGGATTLENLFQPTVQETIIKEENTFLPFSVDSSQENAIKLVKKGKSLVVEGPPGTGKSQLIANLIADFTARGQKVLLVCQKRVALDTVFERLSAIKVASFIALVHDFKNDRKALFEQIFSQIEEIDAYKKQNQSLDAIVLERNYTQISRRIDQISTELENLKIALFDDSICGTSIKNLYLSSNFSEKGIDLSTSYKSFNFHEVAAFEENLVNYFSYEEKLKNSFWQDRLSFSSLNFSVIPTIESSINAIPSFQNSVKEKSKTLLNKIVEVQDLLLIDENIVHNFLMLFNNSEVITLFQAIVATNKYYLAPKEVGNYIALSQELKLLFEQSGLENTEESINLELRKVQLQKAIQANKSSISWLTWKVFSKDKKEVENLLKANKLSLASNDLGTLLAKVDNRIKFEEIAQNFAQKNIILTPSQGCEEQQNIIQNFVDANTAFQLFNSLTHLKNTTIETTNFKNSLNEFIELIQLTKIENKNWENYLSKSQINDLLDNKIDKALIISYLKQNFELFIEADKLKKIVTNTELGIIEQLKTINLPSPLPHENSTKQEFPSTPLHIFQNSLRLAWINDIEEKYPILRGVSTLKIQQLEDELQELMYKKGQLSQEILRLKLREKTYDDLVINRLQNVVSYRELQHQVGKRKKIWSIRKLLENFNEEIFKLIPCWLASPESVSAIFPMEANLFDLVIFDEASQCYAEQGIPSIFRGKQVVIAGDSKQLQPNDLYQIRYEEDTEDNAILEIDSLLDLGSQFLEKIQLKGHYRSHSLELIDFSNHYFYKNTLALLPHYQDIIKKEPAINYLYVNGIWENSINRIEANKVVELIQQLQEKTPSKSIGVVTFNYKQANLIEELLEEINYSTSPTTKVNNSTTNPNNQQNLFVKNIENVQGDERDIIIFSIGYAPDKHEKLLMNFGSLNTYGGENRLNVAITRAKEKIYLICSLFPNQLRVEDTINEGPKLLKKYLEYALNVSNGKYIPVIKNLEKYKNSTLLKNIISAQNSSIVEELPFADLTIKNNSGAYESLLLTDDDLYYESLSAKEAHAYLPTNLKTKGWLFERIWSRNYWRNS